MMLFNFHISVALFCLVVCGVAAKVNGPTTPALLGIELGMEFITAAIFNGSGPVPLGRRAGSQAYRQLMSTWKAGEEDTSHNSDELVAIILTELKNTLEEAKRTGTPNLRLGTIAHPPWFEKARKQPRVTLWNSAQLLDPYFDHGMRLRRAYAISLWTWPESGCSENLLDYYADPSEAKVLLLEQSANELHIKIAFIDNLLHDVEYLRVIPWPSPREVIEDVFEEGMKQIPPMDIAGVVFSSDQATVDFHDVKGLLRSKYPNLVRKIQEPPLEAHYTYAVSAACYARQLAVFPERMEPLDPPHGIGDLHEEL